MALQAKRADIGQVAFAPALHHRDDVVGIPQAFAPAAADAPCGQGLEARLSAQAFELPPASRQLFRRHRSLAEIHGYVD